MDEGEVQFCTHLKGKSSWFLPFNRGWNDGAGNPPNPDGIKTEYLWREVLSRESLTNIIENYAQLVVSKDKKSDKTKVKHRRGLVTTSWMLFAHSWRMQVPAGRESVT